MANFTTAEANASKITRIEQKKNGNTHVSWIFGVTDADGNYYDWTDKSVASNASKSDIKTAIKAHLQSLNKRPAPTVYTYVSATDKGKGENVG